MHSRWRLLDKNLHPPRLQVKLVVIVDVGPVKVEGERCCVFVKELAIYAEVFFPEIDDALQLLNILSSFSLLFFSIDFSLLNIIQSFLSLLDSMIDDFGRIFFHHGLSGILELAVFTFVIH